MTLHSQNEMTLLVVDDNLDNIELMSQLLHEEYQVLTANNGAEGLNVAQTRIPDLIILAMQMSEMDGNQVLQQLKTNPTTQDIMVIILADHPNEFPQIVKGLQLGALDYLNTPIENSLLLAKTGLVARLVKAEQAKIALQERLLQETITDELTGLYNRCYLLRRLSEEFQRCNRLQKPCALIMLDLDHFKAINETYGHNNGNKVLQTTARIIQTLVRSTDIASHYGGEKFCLLLPQTDLQQAKNLALRLCVELAKAQHMASYEKTFHVTGSFGVTQWCDTQDTEEQLLERCDQAMARAKTGGRNQVVLGEYTV